MSQIMAHGILSDTVGDLPCHTFRIAPATPTRVAVEALKQQPDLPGVLIGSAEVCLGMVSRQTCFELLSHPFGTDLFLKRPIQALFETSPFRPTRLLSEMPVTEAVQMALGRPIAQRYEPLILEFGQGTHRLLDVHVLLLAQSELLSRANHLIEQQVDIGRALSSTLELKAVLDLILENMAALVSYDRASIMLQDGEALEFAAARGFPPADKPEHVRVPIQPNDLYWRLSQSKQPLLLSDMASPAARSAFPPQLPTGSWLGLPLIHSNEVIGMLSLARTAAEPYRPEILPLAQTFAAQAAIALQNARLFGEVQRLATTDSLTKLFNRRHFFDIAEREFERALRYGRPLSLLMLDVDHFKQVNDVHGHAVGDHVLQALAARCRAGVRDIDVMARYGGEEFMVLLPETSPAEAPNAAERLRQAVAETPLAVANLHLSITMSVGVASLGDERQGLTLAGLIDRADQALYHAKRAGRNRVGVWGQRASPATSGDLAEANQRPREREASRMPEWSALTILQAVQRVSAAMRAEQTLGALLTRWLDETLAEFYSDTGAIWLYDPAQNKLALTQACGWFAQQRTDNYAPGEGLVGSVFTSGDPYVSREFARDPRLQARRPESIPPGWGGLLVPIRTVTETVGVLCVAVPLPREVNLLETRLLVTLAEMAGNALHRMRLNAQTSEQLKRLTALRTIDLAIAGNRGLRATLALLLEQLTQLLGVDAAAVLMFSPTQQGLHYEAGRGFRTRDIFQANVPLGESQAGRAALEQHLIQVADLRAGQLSPEFASFVGAEDFVAYYAVPLSAKGQVTGVLEVFHRAALKPDAEWLAYLETLGGQAAIAIDNAQLFENLQVSNAELEQAYDATLESWNRMLDLRDHETGDHTQRVVEMVLRLGQAMGLDAEALLQLRRGALLHDIGKMGTPDSILLKPGPLTAEERQIMRHHPDYAYTMLADIAFLRPALDVPYGHHEKWDGSGYPRGLQGDQIPLSARIFAVVDVWDALSSDRPYRPAWQPEKVQHYLREESGHHFDPAVVEAFLNLPVFKEI